MPIKGQAGVTHTKETNVKLNIRELEKAFRLKLASRGARVLLVTKGFTPPIQDSRLLTIAARVPSSGTLLKYAIVVFASPFDKDDADKFERWVMCSNSRVQIVRVDEPLGEILRLESERKRPGQHGWRDQFITEHLSPDWSCIESEGRRLAELSASLLHPISAHAFVIRIKELERAGRIPVRIGKLGNRQLIELILKHVDVNRTVDYREEVRLTSVINEELKRSKRQTTLGSVHGTYRKLLHQGKIPPVCAERKPV